MGNNINKWIGYTIRERRAVFVLLILIIVVIAIRIIVDNNRKPEVIYVNELNVEDNSHDEADSIKNIEHNQLMRAINSPSKLDATIKTKPSNNETPANSYTTDTLHPIENSSIAVSNRTYDAIPDVIVELNSSDSAALDGLTGIGSVLSVRILRYRNLLGGFYSVEQLKEVYGLSAETYQKIKDRVEVDTSKISKIEINKADYRTLLRMPYLEKSDVDNILRYKKIVNSIGSINELIENRVLADSTIRKITPYIAF